MKILIVAGLPSFLPEISFDKLIGVDRGALWLIERGQQLDLAIGDFDSVRADEFERISQQATEVVKLPSEKDETDLEAALILVNERFAQAQITIIGALGGRLDHMLTNIYLPLQFANCEKIELLDEQNLIKYLKTGEHILSRKEGYKYIGFAQINTERTLEINNAKYPLKAEENFADIYASNEFISDKMSVKFDKGYLIVMYSKD